MEKELTPHIIDGINKLACFIREYEREDKKSARRPRCPSCDDGIHYIRKQLIDEQEKEDEETSTH